MKFRPVDPRRVARFFRRHGTIAILTVLAIVAFTTLASIGATDRRGDMARTANATLASAAEKARAILDRQQRGLDQLARTAAVATDAATQQLLDQLPALAPGITGAALADPSGMVEQRSASGADETVLAALAADAAKEAAAQPSAPMLVTQTLRDGDGGTAMVGLARPWRTADGRLGGVALVALDRSAVAGLDLVRRDGSALFTDDKATGAPPVALGDFPMMLRDRPPSSGFWSRHGAWPFGALAIFGSNT